MSYEGDVTYEIWRRGGDPDQIHPDTISTYEGDGYTADEAASSYMRRVERYRQEQIVASLEEYPEEQFESGGGGMKPYSLANVLREGPNVSHRRTSAHTLIIRGAIVATAGILVWLVLL